MLLVGPAALVLLLINQRQRGNWAWVATAVWALVAIFVRQYGAADREASTAACTALTLAALLLTPAYRKSGVSTMAPALIVAAFQIATQGVDAANHALRPLIFMSGLAIVFALLLNMTLFRRRRVRKPPPAKPARPVVRRA